ncbi:hypothetical protein ACTXG6_46145 [Pseudonocardia sp. Cha107L01]|uniref:hypothetical protein n=1 Tax=Pseudonocardia sp. Cha107L01 TaxID=3457576 RepID=UPI00403E70CC
MRKLGRNALKPENALVPGRTCLNVCDSEIISPDVVRHCEATPGIEVTDLDQLKDFLRADASVFPDNKQTFNHVLVDEDMVGIWATYEGAQMRKMGPFPPSEKFSPASVPWI